VAATLRELPFPEPPLTDALIRLRTWRDADIAPAHAAARDDAQIMRYTRIAADRTEQELRDAVTRHESARRAGTELALAIADFATDEFLGAISLHVEQAERRGEIGYWMAPWARGRGAATRAVALLGRWGARELGLLRVALHVDHDNAASQRVAERAGFTREGTLRSYEERKGLRRDVVVFSLVPGDRSAH